ncbi:MAG: pyridoxamine 5'-phosphate oxidase family protein [Deltaproteobacteria bacterium]|nr:pyridoxamine 5'-phosphate oxidase family protein [Deltaproteobacteria bacterium]
MKKLFSSQRLAVLATQSKRQPYGNLVAFMATEDLKYLLFATTRATRKYANISSNPRIAMVVDTRSNQEADFHQAAAVTATGVVKEIVGPQKRRFQKLYLSKHPYLKEFVSSPTCALLKVEVETYYVVRQFQNVVELHIKK